MSSKRRPSSEHEAGSRARDPEKRPTRLPVNRDWNLEELLLGLIADGYLSRGSPAHDVARQILAEGEASLSRAHRLIFERSVLHAVRAYANGEPSQKIAGILCRDN